MITILLVDDHPIVRAGLKAVFTAFDDIAVIAEASDGAAALETLEQLKSENRTPDAVIMDLQMKPMNGIDATAAIRSAGGPPVLVLTTFDTQADIVAAIEAGALGYLLKDAPAEQVHQAVLATAAGKRTLSSEITEVLLERMRTPAPELSPREIELLTALATGATNKQLAKTLFISEATVKTHLVHIYTKLGVDNRTAAISRAREMRLV
ncbi:MAG: response regulator transcription factor [Rothia sp. (in: high G+C Gram-positive bacteria)]|nr:response regulator transcription factor [Rothia sp. (in: high G+C Gram-positive bacteria)]